MSLSVLEVLQNAEYNIKNGVMPFQKQLGLEQLANAFNEVQRLHFIKF